MYSDLVFLASLLEDAYEGFERIVRRAAIEDMTLIDVDPAPGVEYYLLRGTDEAILLLPGMRPWDLLDLVAVAVAMPTKGIHAGFMYYFTALYEKVGSLIRNLRKSMPLRVVGHSLGAAVACIWSLYMPEDRVVALAPPRIGRRRVVDSIPENTVTVVIDPLDPVPWLPFRVLGYAPWRRFVKVGTDHRSYFPSLSRHDIRSYRLALQRIAATENDLESGRLVL